MSFHRLHEICATYFAESEYDLFETTHRSTSEATFHKGANQLEFVLVRIMYLVVINQALAVTGFLIKIR